MNTQVHPDLIAKAATPLAPAPVTVAHGDGIGPEIMAATLRLLDAAGSRLALEEISIGEQAYLAGHSAGIADEAWDSLRRTRVFLKAPISTPQGGGFKSLNVTVRKTLGLYANVRPNNTYYPFVKTRHPNMNVVIIRENEEDLYAGIEHRQTDDVMQCLKLISVPGCERIVRYAFEYARQHGRKKVTCFTKDNIMKMTDGLFHSIFRRIGAEYPELEQEHLIVDIGAARLADSPEIFDVIVMPNLYGDILSDVAAQIAGSVGLAGSANIGERVAMFEAIHGSAPTLAGQDLANPSGLMMASVMMLNHLGQHQAATQIHNAWLRTLERGIHTADLYDRSNTSRKVGTRAFADAVIAHLGDRPRKLSAVDYGNDSAGAIATPMPAFRRHRARKELVGADVFVHNADMTATELAEALKPLGAPEFDLQMITNRGGKVWPNGFPETFCTDHWRCRFLAAAGTRPDNAALARLLARVAAGGIDFIKLENLCTFDGEPGYSLGQGQ